MREIIFKCAVVGLLAPLAFLCRTSRLSPKRVITHRNNVEYGTYDTLAGR